MGVLPRVFAITTMLGLVACAAIAGLEAPAELEQSTTPPDRSTDAATPSPNNPTPQTEEKKDGSPTPPQDAATGTDAGAKDADAAPPPPPPCTKTANGGGCTDGISCCSTACNEAKVCASECRTFGSSCDPFASAPCCYGFYCFTAGCAPCIGAGGAPTGKITGGANSKSCCSRQIGGDGKCL